MRKLIRVFLSRRREGDGEERRAEEEELHAAELLPGQLRRPPAHVHLAGMGGCDPGFATRRGGALFFKLPP